MCNNIIGALIQLEQDIDKDSEKTPRFSTIGSLIEQDTIPTTRDNVDPDTTTEVTL